MWSYDATLSRSLDVVRFLIDDTEVESKQMEDEAIQVFLTAAADNIYLAASRIARLLSTRYAKMTSVWVDTVRIDYAAKARAYEDLSYQLASLSGTVGIGSPFVGGISRSEMHQISQDSDRSIESFQIGMHDDLGDITSDPESIE